MKERRIGRERKMKHEREREVGRKEKREKIIAMTLNDSVCTKTKTRN